MTDQPSDLKQTSSVSEEVRQPEKTTPPEPAAAQSEPANQPSGQTTQPAAGQATEKPATTAPVLGRILLVEDDPPMVKMYSTKFRQEGFEVELAYDGEEALVKIGSHHPDLVLLDLMIPKIGGLEILATLRSQPATKSLPVIILSNLSQEQDIARAKELGALDYLIKANFTPGQVVEKIKAALRK